MKYNLEFVRPTQRAALKKEVEKNLFSSKPLGCICYEDSCIVVDPLHSKYAIYSHEGYKVEGKEAELEGVDVPFRDEVVICMGFFHSVWGHNFTDNIKRIWFLYTEEGKQLLADGAHIVYVCEANRMIPENGQRLFAMADVDFSRFEMIDTTTRFRKLYLPDPSLIHGTITHEPIGDRFYSKEFWETIEKIRQKIQPAYPAWDKVYFSRTGSKNTLHRETGEWEIERIFHQKGYKVVHPENLTLDEQLSVLSSCQYFASTEGSIAHNAIFCRPGTQVVIVRKADYINTYQLVINAVADLDVTYKYAHRTCPPYYAGGKVSAGPFYMYQSHYLIRWAHLHRLVRPYWMRLSYWWYILRRINVVLRIVANRKFVHKLELDYWTRQVNSCKWDEVRE